MSDADLTLSGARRHAALRVALAFGIGAVVFGAGMTVAPWPIAITLAWSVAATVFLAKVWLHVRGADGARTAALATREDPSRVTADLLLVAASGASLIGIALALVQASKESGPTKGLFIATAGLCLVVSWTTVNTVYALRYASLYYGDEPGGISFGDGRTPPTYADFAYLAFTIGMTYQVSDTALGTRQLRKTALRHALLSFVFVTSVVAMSINVVAQLLTL